MEHPGFFARSGPFALRRVLEHTGARSAGDADSTTPIHDVKALDTAGPGDIAFFDNPRYMQAFRDTAATACFVAERYASKAPPGVMPLLYDRPYRAFALALSLFYPDAGRPRTAGVEGWDSPGAVHPTAVLEPEVRVEPGAIVAPEARIGRGTTVAAGALVGYRVHVGRDCYIGPGASVTHALLGDRVVLHAGARLGQDGFGFAMDAVGHLKVPQIGRVVVQDNVEIGAGTTVDRGALRDTVVGEGTKIDNLVQIGHNVVIGRHCVIVAQTGISGSAELEDFVVLGGQVGVVGHVRIGRGAQIAGSSNVRGDVPPGAKWGGTPAKPSRQWFREMTALKKLAEQPRGGHRLGEAPESEQD